MSIAVLPICSDLAVFGASMAGACVGFLLHNRYKAYVFMGDTGSLALGGALAAMAGCTGMFFPLFISSGIFVLETLSVVMQESPMPDPSELFTNVYVKGYGVESLGIGILSCALTCKFSCPLMELNSRPC